MRYILNNLKKRRTAVMFLILGIWIGITVLSVNISYVEGMHNRGRPRNLKDSNYAKFFIGSNEKLITLEGAIHKQVGNMYIGLSVTYLEKGSRYLLIGTDFYDNFKYPSRISGRFLVSEDLELNRKVAVVGSSLRDNLYNRSDKEFISIKGEEYEVVGISKAKSDAHSIIIPMKSFLELEGEKEIRNATFTCIQKSIDEDVVFNSYKSVLGEDTKIFDMKSNTKEPFTAILAFVSVIVVVIAAINVINFTYLWISERKKEIALRKTVGATDEDIRNLILTEIGVIALVALLISVLTGQIVCLLVNNLINLDFYLTISLKNLLLSSATTSIIVLISAYPPYKVALKIEPALVLKEE